MRPLIPLLVSSKYIGSSILAALLLLLAACSTTDLLTGQAAQSTRTAEPTATTETEPSPTAEAQPSLAEEPHPDLSPQDVVRIQLEAMQNNDDPAPDSGIRQAYMFASPSNKEETGPVERFIPMVKGPQYRPMLNFEDYSLGPPDRTSRDTVLQPVLIETPDGRRVMYLFLLSRQTEAPYEDCWMTDGVVPMDQPAPETEEI